MVILATIHGDLYTGLFIKRNLSCIAWKYRCASHAKRAIVKRTNFYVGPILSINDLIFRLAEMILIENVSDIIENQIYGK